jgi:hypothetical protein
MNAARAERPYLEGRLCAECIRPLEITEERRADGGLNAIYACGQCGVRYLVAFSAKDMREWVSRKRGPWERVVTAGRKRA